MSRRPRAAEGWATCALPVLVLLRSLPVGATWPELSAWRARAGYTLDKLNNCLAWLEQRGLARSTGGREVKVGDLDEPSGRVRKREVRVGPAEEVRWHAATPVPALTFEQAAPCPVVRGLAPPGADPPLRGPFLTDRRASARPARPDHPEPDGEAETRRRSLSADRGLRVEACAPKRGTSTAAYSPGAAAGVGVPPNRDVLNGSVETPTDRTRRIHRDGEQRRRDERKKRRVAHEAALLKTEVCAPPLSSGHVTVRGPFGAGALKARLSTEPGDRSPGMSTFDGEPGRSEP